MITRRTVIIANILICCIVLNYLYNNRNSDLIRAYLGQPFLSLFHISLTGNRTVKMATFSPLDPSSFSRQDLAVVTHIKLDLRVHFDRKTFSGQTELTVKKIDPSVDEIILDSKDLQIESICGTASGNKLEYSISEPIGEFGSKLTVKLPPYEGDNFVMTILYETSPNASGLQWLEPQQTAGKTQPFVFSQFQAIHARSFLPCQDSPGVKTKYEAAILCPSDLTVVMSAIKYDKTESEKGTTYRFKQNVPVQTYLIAIAIGALESRTIGPRSTVWAEKEFVEAAAFEFSGTEKQLQTAEEICGSYVWGIYDLLVLPPSFPFGGMENPCLTFVTPTLLAGDRSLANVVAHEIAHSWTGNLVTNANFEHFWLNEGFTVFIERKIIGRLEGKQMQDFQAYAGISELQEAVNQMGKDNMLTSLVVNLTGVHPDDAFSRVPYEKGQLFLRYLEEVVGGPDIFEPFLRKYFETYKYKSVTTSDFKNFYETKFASNPAIKNISWRTWLHAPGMPPIIPEFDKTLIKAIGELKNQWLSWDQTKRSLPFEGDNISTVQKIQLLQEILEEEPQPIAKLELFEEKFQFLEVKNAEIKFLWLRIGIKARWDKVLEPTLRWVNEVGRMKFIRPLYRDLYNWEFSRANAISNFQGNRKNMMHVSAYTVAQDLHL